MNKICIVLGFLLLGGSQLSLADIESRKVEYEHQGVKLEGRLFFNNKFSGKNPGVILFHEWWGVTPELLEKAKQLAHEGYVAFVADLYGNAKHTEHPNEAGKFMERVVSDKKIWRSRARLALEKAKEQPEIDQNNIAAIGFCLGGNTVLQMFYERMDFKVAVAFHSTLVLPEKSDVLKNNKTKLLILHGAYDSLVPADGLNKFTSVMEDTGVDWQLNIYPAKHGFTNPKADSKNLPALAYNYAVTKKSWKSMHILFSSIFN